MLKMTRFFQHIHWVNPVQRQQFHLNILPFEAFTFVLDWHYYAIILFTYFFSLYIKVPIWKQAKFPLNPFEMWANVFPFFSFRKTAKRAFKRRESFPDVFPSATQWRPGRNTFPHHVRRFRAESRGGAVFISCISPVQSEFPMDCNEFSRCNCEQGAVSSRFR